MSLKKIVTKNLEDNAITEPKLAAGSVTSAKISTDLITGQTELTSVAENDKLVIYDASAGTLKKVNKSYTTTLTTPTFTSVSPDNVQTVDGGTVTFTITGSGFTTGTNARLIGNSGQRLNFTTVTRNSTTQITATIARSSMLLTQSPYGIQVINGEGLATVAASQVAVDTTPLFQTASGTLGSVLEGASFSATVEAHDPDSTSPVNFEIVSGSLPSGITLTNNNNDTCTISGTAPTVSSDTTYNFTLRAYDSASNYNDRAFSITVEDFALNGLRFNDGSSDYLNKTFSSGNRKTWTFSVWLKRSDLITSRIFCTIASGVDDYIKFDTSHRIEWGFDHEDLSNRGKLITNRVFRDVSAWYHIICAVDTTNATAGNRMRIYINGVEETSFATDTNPTLNEDGQISNANPHFLSSTSSAQFYDGYMSEVHFIDGQQLTPSSFGETDATSGIWVPKKYSGSYGTNGFYLDFADSADLGNDVSGNNNDFTENNITSIDKVTDTPQNNFATLNPLDLNSTASYSFSEGNVKTANTNFTRSTFGHSVGKWYVESKCVSTACWNGVRQVGQDVNQEWSTNSVSLFIGGATLYISGVSQGLGGYGSSWSANDIMMMALDLDSGTQKIYFGKNGGWWNGSDYSAGSPSTGVTLTSGLTWQFQFGSGSGTSTQEVNFGNPSFSISSGNSDDNGYGNFEYAPPSGYLALCSKNLATNG